MTIEPSSARRSSKQAGAKPARKKSQRAATTDAAFWSSPSLAALASAQGVKPLSRESLQRASFWPDDLDPRDFVAPAYKDRRRADAGN